MREEGDEDEDGDSDGEEEEEEEASVACVECGVARRETEERERAMMAKVTTKAEIHSSCMAMSWNQLRDSRMRNQTRANPERPAMRVKTTSNALHSGCSVWGRRRRNEYVGNAVARYVTHGSSSMLTYICVYTA